MSTKKQKKFIYYDIRKTMLAYPEPLYYVIIGERSNGKTYSSLDYALERYAAHNEQFAYVRRFGEDIRKSKLSNLFNAHVENGRVTQLFSDDWTNIEYGSGKFNLSRINPDTEKPEYSDEPIGFAFDLNSMEHYKSISFPRITTIIFDEFLSRTGYLPNEFTLFMNTISTIVRNRKNLKIIMLGNTVNKYAPYFGEMGLSHIKEQKQGTVDIYKYSNSGLQVAVEYCSSAASQGGKASDVYFAFDNPQLQMITKGSWEIAIYPHLDPSIQYKPKNIAAQFFVDFDGELLHGEIVAVSNYAPFIFIHRKTTPIKDDNKDIIYGQRASYKPNYLVGLQNKFPLSSFINQAIRESRVFYSTNEVGEIFRNYLMWCQNLGITKGVMSSGN